MLLLREKNDGTIRQRHIKGPALLLATIFAVGLFSVLLGMYLLSQNKENRSRMDEYEQMVTKMSDEIVDLEKENGELSNKMELLSETVATKVALEEIREEELIESSLPKGFPLGGSGSATIEEDAEDALTMILHATDGNTVVSVGAGVVESISTDEKYGCRLVIDHQNGYKSVYLYGGQPLVKEGEELGKRYILFLMDAPALSLAYQVLINDEQINPMDIMEVSG